MGYKTKISFMGLLRPATFGVEARNDNKGVKSLTLIELMVVLVVAGILSTLAMPAMNISQENSLDREAFSNLRRLQEAQRFYRMRLNIYYASNVHSNLNDNLLLSLPEGGTLRWNYRTFATGCSQARRNVAGGRTWHLHIDDTGDPANGNCS